MENSYYYKGFEVKIHRDDDAQNPFEDWDTSLPTMVEGRGYNKDYSDGTIQSFLSGFLDHKQVLQHKDAIVSMVGYFADDLQEDDTDDIICDTLSDAIENYLEDSLENKAKFCTLFNIPHLLETSRGYSQGDSVDVLVVYTKEWGEMVGLKMDEVDDKQLRSTFDMYGAWAWGDVYGAVIEGLDEDNSCWGFYGTDMEKSGLMPWANGEIEGHIKWLTKQRVKAAKRMIEAKVPLLYRDLSKYDLPLPITTNPE